MAKTRIEWADATWSPVTGCTKVSAGCAHCYAERMSKRLAGRCGYPADEPFWVTLHPERLREPWKWKKPRRVFVCSMGDLFHPDVPGRFINEVWMAMRNATQHTYLILTKRPELMLAWSKAAARAKGWLIDEIWPGNIWLGVSAENQQAADERIPILLQIPAAVRFVSVEPMLGPVEIEQYLPEYDYRPAYEYYRLATGCDDKPILIKPGLDWVIVGGETGPNARAMNEGWAKSLRDQCTGAGTPFFYKQIVIDGKKIVMPELEGKIWNQFPLKDEIREVSR